MRVPLGIKAIVQPPVYDKGAPASPVARQSRTAEREIRIHLAPARAGTYVEGNAGYTVAADVLIYANEKLEPETIVIARGDKYRIIGVGARIYPCPLYEHKGVVA